MLLVMGIITATFACISTCWLLREATQRNNVTTFDRHRIMLNRLICMTRTTRKKAILALCIGQDVLALLSCLFGVPAFIQSVEDYCELVYATFLLMLNFYQLFAIIRVLIFVCHFIYGQRFWRWVKRLSCCKCLSVIEYEQRVTFDIYDAKDYVKKVNQNLALSKEDQSPNLSRRLSRQSSLKQELKFEDLTCAICLEGFEQRDNHITPQPLNETGS